MHRCVVIIRNIHITYDDNTSMHRATCDLTRLISLLRSRPHTIYLFNVAYYFRYVINALTQTIEVTLLFKIFNTQLKSPLFYSLASPCFYHFDVKEFLYDHIHRLASYSPLYDTSCTCRQIHIYTWKPVRKKL